MSKKDLSKYFDLDTRMKRHFEKRAQFSQVSDVFKRSKVRESNLTTQNAGPRAVQLVREVLNNYNLQTPPKLSYSGVRDVRVASNSSKIENGVVTINAQVKSPSSVNVQFDVPVEIHDGEMLEPAIIVVAGAPKVISQSTFDTLMQENSIFKDDPIKKQYGPPMTKQQFSSAVENRQHRVKRNNGLFSVSANVEKVRDAIAGKAVTAEWEKPWLKKEEDKAPEGNDEIEKAAKPKKDKKKKKAQQVNPDGTPISNDQIVTPISNDQMAKQWENAWRTRVMDPNNVYEDEYANAVDPYYGILGDDPGIDVLDEEFDSSVPNYSPEGIDNTDEVFNDINEELLLEEAGNGMPINVAPVPKMGQYLEDDDVYVEDADRNEQDDDFLDPAERDTNDIHIGKEKSLSKAIEVKDRGGVTHDFSKGTKVQILRDHAGDNKSFVVKFDNGLEAIVERSFLAQKHSITSKKKNSKPPKMCSQCGAYNCKHHRKKSDIEKLAAFVKSAADMFLSPDQIAAAAQIADSAILLSLKGHDKQLIGPQLQALLQQYKSNANKESAMQLATAIKAKVSQITDAISLKENSMEQVKNNAKKLFQKATPQAPAQQDPAQEAPPAQAPAPAAPQAPAQAAPQAPAQAAPQAQGERASVPMSDNNLAFMSLGHAIEELQKFPAYQNAYGPKLTQLQDLVKNTGDKPSKMYMNIPEIERLEQHMKQNAPKLYRMIGKDLENLKRGIQPASDRPQKGLPGLWNKAKDWARGESAHPKSYEEIKGVPDINLQSNKQAQLDKLSKIKAEVDDMYAEGMSEADIRTAVFHKFGPEVAQQIFVEKK